MIARSDPDMAASPSPLHDVTALPAAATPAPVSALR